MTSPLREMAAAASEMAKGNYERRVRSSSRDEVGELARAFNQMAADLAETDRVRRDLVANVSHELRTPITALQVLLENLVDGVAEPEPETFLTMLTQVERLGRLVKQLLDLSRLESGAVPLERTAFRVEPLLAHAVREQRLHAPEIDVSIAVDSPDLTADGDPERELDRSRLARILAACLAKLAPAARDAVVLRYQQELSYDEAAELAGELPGTLQRRVARALPILRRCVEANRYAGES
jgi:RNA polymerase sigma factor (sigma-70 family)